MSDARRYFEDIQVGEAYESEIRAGGEVLLARIEPDAGLSTGDAVHFRLDPAHGLLVAR